MKVKCAHDGLVSIKKLIPHPKNRNKHPKEQIERLAKVLQYQGIRRPVRVSELSGYITAGHCLYEAAKLLKWKELPVDYQPYDSEDQEIADGIADNSIALWADLDFAGINMDVPGLGPDFDIDWLGIREFGIDPNFSPGSEDEQGRLDEKKLIFMECPHCGKQFEQGQARKIEA